MNFLRLPAMLSGPFKGTSREKSTLRPGKIGFLPFRAQSIGKTRQGYWVITQTCLGGKPLHFSRPHRCPWRAAGVLLDPGRGAPSSSAVASTIPPPAGSTVIQKGTAAFEQAFSLVCTGVTSFGYIWDLGHVQNIICSWPVELQGYTSNDLWAWCLY